MSIPPIGPSAPAPGTPPEGTPLRERVHKDLTTIQQMNGELQTTLVSHGSPSQIHHLLQNLQSPIQDLAQITNQRPPVLSQNEVDIIKAMNTQYQMMQMDTQSVTPSSVAALQGSSNTLEQMFAAELAGIPEPNSSALQAQNYLSALSETLQLHVKANGIQSPDSEAIINSMKSPVTELSHLSERGILSPAQSDVVNELATTYAAVIQVPGIPTPKTLVQFQTHLQTLNQLLTSG